MKTPLGVVMGITAALAVAPTLWAADQVQDPTLATPNAQAKGEVTAHDKPNRGIPTQAMDASGKATSPEARLLTQLHMDNQMEIQAGQLAKDNAQSDAVKQFGQTLIDDHQRADQRVQQVASQQGITLTDPAQTTASDQKEAHQGMQMMDRLKQLKGAEFDKKFAQSMASDHRKEIQKLERHQASLPESSPVRQLISELLPTLKTHQQTAQQLSQTAAPSRATKS